MPLYDFRCVRGHESERLVSMTTASVTCSCGQQAKRQSVYPFATGLKDWGGEFRVPSDVRSAIDESNGYKAEAVAAMKEAVGNGWRNKNA